MPKPTSWDKGGNLRPILQQKRKESYGGKVLRSIVVQRGNTMRHITEPASELRVEQRGWAYHHKKDADFTLESSSGDKPTKKGTGQENCSSTWDEPQ